MRWTVVLGLVVGCDGNPVKPCEGDYVGAYEGNASGNLVGTLRRARISLNRVRGFISISMSPHDPEERDVVVEGWVKKVGGVYLDEPDGQAFLYSGMVFEGIMDFDTCEISGDWQHKSSLEDFGNPDGMWMMGAL